VTDLDALRALMEADRWLERVAAQRSHLPEAEELGRVEGELRGLAGELRSAQEASAPVRETLASTHAEGARLEARARDLTVKLSQSSVAAPTLAALQRELDHVRELQSSLEDREIELLLEIEPLDEAVENIKAAAAPLVARRAELQSQVAALQASLDDELVSLNVEREAKARAVPAAFKERYDAALARAGVSGAAQVVGGRCDGCRIALAPLDLDRVKGLAEGEIGSCPECGRLLLL
jgi:uncharacterized protein